MNKGTRRMWARRVLRAGWLIAPVLQAPKKIAIALFTENNYNERDENGNYKKRICVACIIGVCGITFMLTMFGNFIYSMEHGRRNASASAIEDVMKNDSCMLEYLPRVKAGQDHPLTYNDLDRAHDECVRAQINADADEEQKRAMSKFTKETK